MAVSGKYKTRFTQELLWKTLLSSDAICYAIPELVRLERIDTEGDQDSSGTMMWRGEGVFPGSVSGLAGGTGSADAAGTTTAIITASNLDPYNSYTLQFESEIGRQRVQAAASITLTAETSETDAGQGEASSSATHGTLILWDAEIRDAASGRPHAMFEWMAGLAAQHFFRRIDQYLKHHHA